MSPLTLCSASYITSILSPFFCLWELALRIPFASQQSKIKKDIFPFWSRHVGCLFMWLGVGAALQGWVYDVEISKLYFPWEGQSIWVASWFCSQNDFLGEFQRESGNQLCKLVASGILAAQECGQWPHEAKHGWLPLSEPRVCLHSEGHEVSVPCTA